jgi:hypothetical protein
MKTEPDLSYTYEIYDPVLNMKYIGSRTAKGIKDPYKDNYMGSLKSKKWKEQWKEITQRSHKRILAVFFSKEEALQHEIELHNFYYVGANPEFFNGSKQTSRGFSNHIGNPGLKHTAEAKKKISDARKGKPGGWNGKKHSEETRKKISDAKKGKPGTWIGKKHSEETRKKISEARKGKPNPMFGKKHSDETKRKISESRKKFLKQAGRE